MKCSKMLPMRHIHGKITLHNEKGIIRIRIFV